MLGQRTFVVSDNYIRQRKSRDRFVQNQDQEIALIFFKDKRNTITESKTKK